MSLLVGFDPDITYFLSLSTAFSFAKPDSLTPPEYDCPDAKFSYKSSGNYCAGGTSCWLVVFACSNGQQHKTTYNSEPDVSFYEKQQRVANERAGASFRQTLIGWAVFGLVCVGLVGIFYVSRWSKRRWTIASLTTSDGMSASFKYHNGYTLLLDPKISVTATLRMTNEARAIVEYYSLHDMDVITEKPYTNDKGETIDPSLQLQHLYVPMRKSFSDVVQARNWEIKIVRGLKFINEYIVANARVPDAESTHRFG
jgi:hypothetical protein